VLTVRRRTLCSAACGAGCKSCDLEIKRAGLAEAFVEITREAGLMTDLAQAASSASILCRVARGTGFMFGAKYEAWHG